MVAELASKVVVGFHDIGELFFASRCQDVELALICFFAGAVGARACLSLVPNSSGWKETSSEELNLPGDFVSH